jgi:hypothetical protein
LSWRLWWCCRPHHLPAEGHKRHIQSSWRRPATPFSFFLDIYQSTALPRTTPIAAFVENKNDDDDDDDNNIVSIETRNWEHIFNFSSGRELRYSLCFSSPAWWRKREIVFFLSFSSKLQIWTDQYIINYFLSYVALNQ